MSPEAALVIVVALLWGPTMVWLLFRLARGQTSHRAFGTRDERSGSTTQQASAATDLNALVDTFGFWLCESCKSLNRAEARRCYSCRAGRAGPIVRDPGVPSPAPTPTLGAANTTTWQAVGPGRPVAAAREPERVTAEAVTMGAVAASDALAAAAVGTTGDGVVRGAVPADDRPAPSAPPSPADAGQASPARAVTSLPAEPTAPGMSPGTSPAEPPGVSQTTGPDISEGMVVSASAPSPVGSPVPAPAPRAGLGVCPFVGLDGDPSTWFDFPDPNNQCHAVQPDDGTLLASVLRRVGARPSARLLDAEVQRTRCLTLAHRECARYLLAMKVLAVADGGNGTKPAVAGDDNGTKPSVAAASPHTHAEALEFQPAPATVDPGRGTSPQPAATQPAPEERAGTRHPAAAVATEAPPSGSATTEPVPDATPRRAGASRSTSPGTTNGDARPSRRRTGTTASKATTSKATTSRARKRTSNTVPDQPAETTVADQAATPDEKPPRPRRASTSRKTAQAEAGRQSDPATDGEAAETSTKRRKRSRSSTAGTGKRGASTGSTTKGRKSASSSSKGSRASRS